MQILKCWNGIIGCSAFEIEIICGFKSIDEAGEYYKSIWGYCWIEDEAGKIIKKF